MAITVNAKGTSYPSYTIGKKGVTLYQGSSTPGSAKEGDIWFDTTDGSIKSYTDSSFTPPVVSGTLEVTGNITTGSLVLNDTQKTLRKSDTNSFLNLAGGNTTANGGNIMLYGSTHSSLANDIKLRSGSTTILHYDASATTTTMTGDVVAASFSGDGSLLTNLPSTSPTLTSPQTGGGTLTWGTVHLLKDSNTYTLPAASSVAINESIIVELPSTYSASTPTVQRAGADTISHIGGTDTSFVYNDGAKAVRFTSNGVDGWEI